MVEIFDNVLTAEEIKTLLDYYHQDDSLVDDRLDVRSKSPDWASSQWPRDLIQRVLDQVLPDAYSVEVVLFYGSRISFKLHVDSGNGDTLIPYKNVLIPLYLQGTATTVLFDNYWHGPHVRFGRSTVSPFLYNLPNRTGQLQTVPDIRALLEQCRTCAESVQDFVVDEEFIQILEHIVAARSQNSHKPPDDYVTDYRDIINYRRDDRFDPQLHQRYLNHIPIENLHGLSIDKIVSWQPGQAVTFDRNQIHAAGSGHEFKIGISIFTYKDLHS
jgi:hypothetical protein